MAWKPHAARFRKGERGEVEYPFHGFTEPIPFIPCAVERVIDDFKGDIQPDGQVWIVQAV